MNAPILEVDSLTKRYAHFQALQGVSLRVETGELFGLLGPNGAGKTTLLSILAGLSDATSGEAKLFGKPIRKGHKAMKPLIGIGTQDVAVYGELTARENLIFFGKLYGMSGKELETRVDEVLAEVALSDRANDRAGTFSGGMKRRLNLAVAVVHRPKLLFLDEPTTGVDPQSRNHIFEQVQRLNAEGMTIIYTSHYMEEVQTLCKRIAILDHGKIIACDTLTGLLRLLTGTLFLKVARVNETLLNRLAALPEVHVQKVEGVAIRLQCADVPKTTVAVVALLSELQVELTGLTTQEPNLERVFLHLTGHALRD